jgi:hypothetical protein
MEDKINLRWRKSSYSGNGGGNCIEVAAVGRVMVRDSQDRAGTVLRFPSAAWRKFADQVKRSLAPDPPCGYATALPRCSLFRLSARRAPLCSAPMPIRVVRTAVVFEEARMGFGGDLEPAVVPRAGPEFP